ncbi:MAG TPA: TQO small subunit DoxD, partial [Ktedonobacteraceae bacterium]|nr:TQO small subunit DoxD [Ktedonobacteraceae bacterium]
HFFAGWVLLPMRLFLGITFVYAGIQKLTDPQFFHRSTPGYIGNQIMAFAHGSPLQYFLTHIALPHAILFGMTVALGEIAIGLGALLGVLFRPAAFFGMLLSALFFLSASWHIYPYFYGSDIVFVFCWLTLLFNGPRNTGLPAVDVWLVDHIFPAGPTLLPGSLAALCRALLTGWSGPSQSTSVAIPTGSPSPSAWTSEKSRNKQRTSVVQNTHKARRHFVQGMLTGVAGVLGVIGVGYLFHMINGSSATPSSSTNNNASTSAIPSDTSQPASTSTNTSAGTGTVIAQANTVPKNDATTFTIPSTGDPGVLIHLLSDQFVAYDATCTHAGCAVDYDPPTHLLYCPCHGAAYDPAKGAAVLQGPTDTPLTPLSIHIDSTTGSILLQQ